MITPLGERIKTIFIDEYQDLVCPHPDRILAWEDACRNISLTPRQRVFVSGSHPPGLQNLFVKKAHIDPSIRLIRACTDRPEIAYYVLNIESRVNEETLWLSCIKLVKRLNRLLEPEERILVFLPSRACVERLSEATKCAMYHSQLPKVDNTKAYNLHRWDTGDSKVMAATTAAGQGIDRPYVKYVVIMENAFGFPAYVQQAGRSGRGGRFSYTILLRNPHFRITVRDRMDVNYVKRFEKYSANGTKCRRQAVLDVMDGEDMSTSCLDNPACNPCDVCDPSSDMLKIVWEAATLPPTTGYPNPRHMLPLPTMLDKAPLPLPKVTPNSRPMSTLPRSLVEAPVPLPKAARPISALPRLLVEAPVPVPKATTKQSRSEKEGVTCSQGSEDGFKDLTPLPSSIDRIMDEVEEKHFRQKVRVFFATSTL